MLRMDSGCRFLWRPPQLGPLFKSVLKMSYGLPDKWTVAQRKPRIFSHEGLSRGLDISGVVDSVECRARKTGKLRLHSECHGWRALRPQLGDPKERDMVWYCVVWVRSGAEESIPWICVQSPARVPVSSCKSLSVEAAKFTQSLRSQAMQSLAYSLDTGALERFGPAVLETCCRRFRTLSLPE